MTDTLLLVLVLGAVNHQVTHILTVGIVFESFRQWVGRTFGQDSKIKYLVHCHLCAGTWIGFGMALVTMDAVQLVTQPVVNFVLLAFAIALVGRVWNECLALMSSKVAQLRTPIAAEGVRP